jgi:hypothetical protein
MEGGEGTHALSLCVDMKRARAKLKPQTHAPVYSSRWKTHMQQRHTWKSRPLSNLKTKMMTDIPANVEYLLRVLDSTSTSSANFRNMYSCSIHGVCMCVCVWFVYVSVFVREVREYIHDLLVYVCASAHAHAQFTYVCAYVCARKYASVCMYT